MRNESKRATDNRSIVRIIYEKATFTAAPTHFQVSGDDRWHPCQFVHNKDLAAVSFSDGSVYYVDSKEPLVANTAGPEVPESGLSGDTDNDPDLGDLEAELVDTVTEQQTDMMRESIENADDDAVQNVQVDLGELFGRPLKG